MANGAATNGQGPITLPYAPTLDDTRPLAAPPWWILPILAILAAAALSVDEWATHLLTDTGLHHKVWHAITLAEPIIGTAILVVCIASYPNTRKTWEAIAMVCGALLINGTLTAVLMRTDPSSSAATAIRSAQGAVGWALILGLLGLHANGARLCGGFLAAVLLSTAVTHLLKWAIGRARPQTDLGLLHFEPFHGGLGDLESLPSGHSSAAATLAVLLGIYFPRARPLFYAFALMVGFSRVVADKHFLSDVLAGFMVGTASVLLCVRLLGKSYYRRGVTADGRER
ncbi:MAG: phosphatase PAP2 family protein [Phycisphaerae bacterium]|nr:phosphatase PAP2 family protein [Phycisphaerae bacterium]